MRELSLLSLYNFLRMCVYFSIFDDKMHNYVKQNIIVHFIIQKLKNKHTFHKNIQTEKAGEPLILTEREETKTRYFPPYWGLMRFFGQNSTNLLIVRLS